MTDEVESKQPFDAPTDSAEQPQVIERSGNKYSFTAERTDDLAVIRCQGEFDLIEASTPEFKEVAVGLYDDGVKDFLINLESVTFLDSTYLGVMVGLHKRVRPHRGKVSLIVGDNRHVKNLFHVTGLDRAFSLYDDEAAARAELNSRST